MADIKAQLKAKNGDNLYPVTSLAYVSAVSSGGIVINGNSIYTSAIPQANVYRLTTSLGAKQAKCSAGFRTYVSGATIGQNRYFDIAAPVSSGTLTVSAGSAYRIFATGNTVTVNAEGSASSAGVFGLEGHAAILLTNSSYLKFGTNVVLGAPLQIDAINNCTLRFHDGHCIIDVEDHEAAHAVTVATGTGTGSLYYWANWANTTSASATPAYVSFSDALDGIACTFNGVTVNGDKHLVGNGKTLTVVTGTATASSKTYLTNMAISGATITGGTVYATDVLIPSGATTVISSPLIASNTLDIDGTLRTPGSLIPTNGLVISGGYGMGNGGVIDLGKTAVPATALIQVSGVTLTNGLTAAQSTNNGSGGVFRLNSGSVGVSNAAFVANSATVLGACAFVNTGATMTVANTVFNNNNCAVNGGCFYTNGVLNISSCTFSSNTAKRGGMLYVGTSGHATITDSEITSCNATNFGGAVALYGNNADLTLVNCYVHDNGETNGAFYVQTNGAGSAHLIISGSTIQNSINMLESRASTTFSGTNVLGSTVYGSGSAIITSGATLDITGNTNATPVNPGGGITFEQGGATVLYSSGAVSGSYMMDNVTLPAGAKLTNTGVINLGGSVSFISSGGTAYISGCTVTGGSRTGVGGAFVMTSGNTLVITSAVISGNVATSQGGALFMSAGCSARFENSVVSGNSVRDVYLYGGGQLDIIGGTFGAANNQGLITLNGHTTVYEIAGNGSTTISSGAIIDLTGNTKASPISQGKGVTVSGGCTVINSAGASVSIAGGTYTQIKKDGTTA